MASSDDYATNSRVSSLTWLQAGRRRRDEAGRKLAQIRLRVTFRPLAVDLIAESPASFPDDAEFVSSSGMRAKLTKATSGWYKPLSLPVSHQILIHGLKLRTHSFAVALSGAPIHVLSLDPQLAGWSSVRQVDPMEEHMLAVHDSVAEAVRRYLNQLSCKRMVRRVQGHSGSPRRVDLSGRLTTAKPRRQGLPVSARASAAIASMLLGRVALNRLRNVYLTGKRPPYWYQPKERRCGTYGSRLMVRAGICLERIGAVFLHARELAAGEHRIAVGPTNLSLHLVESAATVEAAGTGTIGHVVDVDNATQAVTLGAGPIGDHHLGRCRVSGGAVLDDDPQLKPIARPVVILREATEYILLGSPRSDCHAESAKGAAMAAVSRINAVCFEVYPSFPVVLGVDAPEGWMDGETGRAPAGSPSRFVCQTLKVVDCASAVRAK